MLAVNLSQEPRKRCTKCSRMLVLSCFHRQASTPDGHRPDCKGCRKGTQADHYKRNAAKIKTYARERYQNDPAVREAALTRHKERQANDPAYREAAKARAIKHAPKARRKRKQNPKWVLADRVRQSLSHALAKRAYVKRGKTFELIGYTPTELRDYLMPYVGEPCVRCGETTIQLDNAHIDHITPIRTAESREDVLRLNALANLRLICALCNLTKQGQIED